MKRAARVGVIFWILTAILAWADSSTQPRLEIPISNPPPLPESPLESLPSIADENALEALRAEKSGQAAEALKIVDQLDPEIKNRPEVIVLQAQILTELERFSDGEKLLREAIKAPLTPPNLVAAYEEALGDLLLRDHHFSAAVEAYQAAWPDSSKTVSREFILKEIYAQAGDNNVPEAQKLLLLLQPMDQTSPVYYFGKAAIDQVLGQEAQVKQEIETAQTIYGVVRIEDYNKTFHQVFRHRKETGPSVLANP